MKREERILSFRIKNSDDRLQKLQDMKAPQQIIDSEKELNEELKAKLKELQA